MLGIYMYMYVCGCICTLYNVLKHYTRIRTNYVSTKTLYYTRISTNYVSTKLFSHLVDT